MLFHLQVIDQGPARLIDRDEAAILGLVIQHRDPIVGLVLLDLAGRAGRGTCSTVVHVEAESVAAHDRVDMV